MKKHRHSWKRVADVRQHRTIDALWWCKKCGALVYVYANECCADYKSIRYPVLAMEYFENEPFEGEK